MAWYNWSQTASSNASADPSINWAEGQAPSSINDSARAMMAVTAMYRDDIAGAIVTGGSTSAYTVASYSDFDTLAHLNGQMIAFTPNATNIAGSPSVTLNVDGLGAKPLRTAPNVELLAGTIIQGTPYVALYNNSDGAFYLRGFYGNPYNVPLLGGMDFWDTIAPNSSFIFPAGQAISRTTYATAFARWGTTYGVGDGSTTFNVPDKTGRVSAMIEAAATRLTAAGFGGNSTLLGAVGGTETYTMQRSDLPNVAPTFAGSSTSVSVTSAVGGIIQNATIVGGIGSGGSEDGIAPGANASTVTSTGSCTPNGTVQSLNGNVSQTAEKVVQPTITCNYIIRII